MAADWHYTSDGRQLGPVPAAELKKLVANETVGPDDLLWQIGMPSWVPARDVKGLFPSLLPNDSSVPPPIPRRSLASSARAKSPQMAADLAVKPPTATEEVAYEVEERSGSSDRLSDLGSAAISGIQTAGEKVSTFIRSDAVQSRKRRAQEKWLGLTKQQRIITAAVGGVGILFVVLIVGSVGSSLFGIGGSNGGGISLPGLSGKPKCEEFLRRIEQLHGWEGSWNWRGKTYREAMALREVLGPNDKSYLRQFEGELEPPTKFGTYEQHDLHSDAGTGQYDPDHVIDTLGNPHDRKPNRDLDDSQWVHYEIWIYKCSDGEVRIPIMLLNVPSKPKLLQIIRPIEVFHDPQDFIFEVQNK